MWAVEKKAEKFMCIKINTEKKRKIYSFFQNFMRENKSISDERWPRKKFFNHLGAFGDRSFERLLEKFMHEVSDAEIFRAFDVHNNAKEKVISKTRSK